MKTISATATKRITRRKFGNTGRVITIADKGDVISINVSDTHMPDGSVKRVFTVYPDGMSMGYAITSDELEFDQSEADKNVTSARQYRINVQI